MAMARLIRSTSLFIAISASCEAAAIDSSFDVVGVSVALSQAANNNALLSNAAFKPSDFDNIFFPSLFIILMSIG